VIIVINRRESPFPSYSKIHVTMNHSFYHGIKLAGPTMTILGTGWQMKD
jgi:hypothetical protein